MVCPIDEIHKRDFDREQKMRRGKRREEMLSKRTLVLDIIFLAVGAVIAALAIELFLLPVAAMDGGVTGISMILSKLTPVSLSVYIMVLNIPFLLLGYHQIGRSLLYKSVYAMVIFSGALVWAKHIKPLTTDSLLSVVFGGLVLGIGAGTVLKMGGCLDGTEALAILISKKTSLSIGQFVLCCNIVIYSVAGALFGVDKALYSLLTYFITSRVIDFLQQGLNSPKAIMIITDEAKSVADAIYQKLGRTVTIMEGRGLISGEKVILYCVVTRLEVAEIKEIIQAQDMSAFVTITDVEEIVGNHVKSNKKIKEMQQKK
jgi:uncharacterized membrane-anchored protein YitT (DUF2179 family)